MTERSEFIVVGAGLLGLATARALASRGREVTVLEQAEIGHPAGGSHGSCRIFRLGYGDPGYVSLASRARDLWRQLETEQGLRLLYPAPQLTFGAGLGAVQAAMIAAGAPCELLPAATAAARFPALATAGPALLEPDSCVIAAGNALRALAATVPVISTGVRVTAVADDGRQVTVSTEAGSFAARVVVVCAGPWTSGLLRSAGLAVPSPATLERVAYLQRGGPGPTPDLPIFIRHGARSPYGLPVPRSSLYKIGIHPGGPPVDPDRQDQGPDEEQAGGWAGSRAATCRAWIRGRCASRAASTTTRRMRTSSLTGLARSSSAAGLPATASSSGRCSANGWRTSPLACRRPRPGRRSRRGSRCGGSADRAGRAPG